MSEESDVSGFTELVIDSINNVMSLHVILDDGFLITEDVSGICIKIVIIRFVAVAVNEVKVTILEAC